MTSKKRVQAKEKESPFALVPLLVGSQPGVTIGIVESDVGLLIRREGVMDGVEQS